MKYITEEFVNQTKYKSIKDAYDRDYFSIVSYMNGIWIEKRNCPTTIYNRIIKELERIYPTKYIFID